jgi:hypothetical protein
MTRAAQIQRERLVAFHDAGDRAGFGRLFASFRPESGHFCPICPQAGAPLPSWSNAMSLRLAITRLASPNRLNNCAAFLASPL